MAEPKLKEEIEEEDAFSRGVFGLPFQEELEAMSDLQLAAQEIKISGKVAEIIIKNEWRRRDKLEQHKLNQEIINQQHQLNLEIAKLQNEKSFKSALVSAGIGFIGAIVGAILTVYGSQMATKQELTRQQEKQKIESNTISSSQGIQQSKSLGPNHGAEKIEKEVSSQTPSQQEKNK